MYGLRNQALRYSVHRGLMIITETRQFQRNEGHRRASMRPARRMRMELHWMLLHSAWPDPDRSACCAFSLFASPSSCCRPSASPPSSAGDCNEQAGAVKLQSIRRMRTAERLMREKRSRLEICPTLLNPRPPHQVTCSVQLVGFRTRGLKIAGGESGARGDDARHASKLLCVALWCCCIQRSSHFQTVVLLIQSRSCDPVPGRAASVRIEKLSIVTLQDGSPLVLNCVCRAITDC